MSVLHRCSGHLTCTRTTCQRRSDFGRRRASRASSAIYADGVWPSRLGRQDRYSKATWVSDCAGRTLCMFATRRLRLVTTGRFYFCELCGEHALSRPRLLLHTVPSAGPHAAGTARHCTTSRGYRGISYRRSLCAIQPVCMLLKVPHLKVLTVAPQRECVLSCGAATGEGIVPCEVCSGSGTINTEVRARSGGNQCCP